MNLIATTLNSKECPSCKEEKGIESFPKSSSTKSGYDYKCKACHRAAWHKKKTLVADWLVLPVGFVPTRENISTILRVDSLGRLRWVAEISAHARAGQIAGNQEKGKIPRVFIKGKRYRGDDLIRMIQGEEPLDRDEIAKTLRAEKVYSEEWTRHIKQQWKAFPDWSSIAQHEIQKARGRRKYSNLSTEERGALNKRNNKARSKRDPAKKREWGKKWRKLNAKKIKESKRIWRVNNPDKVRANAKRQSEKPINKIKSNLRKRLRSLVGSARRNAGIGFSTLTGCNTHELRFHLESQFKRGMTWNNYGQYWHVDHIIPVASFDQDNEQQRKQCWHFTNLQPLKAEDNLAKSDTITAPQMRLML